MLEVLEERNLGNMVEKKHGVLRKQMTKLVKLKLTSSGRWLIRAEQDPNPGRWKTRSVSPVARQRVCQRRLIGSPQGLGLHPETIPSTPQPAFLVRWHVFILSGWLSQHQMVD